MCAIQIKDNLTFFLTVNDKLKRIQFIFDYGTKMKANQKLESTVSLKTKLMEACEKLEKQRLDSNNESKSSNNTGVCIPTVNGQPVSIKIKLVGLGSFIVIFMGTRGTIKEMTNVHKF